MEHVLGSSESWSSGCDSGWTLYLEHSMHHHHPSHSFQNHTDFICNQNLCTHEDYHEDDDEDMSMVSDASSGPPHLQEHQQAECYNKLMNPTTRKVRQKLPKQPISHTKLQDLPSFLDDTASSPYFSNNNLTVSSNKASMEENDIIDYSQGYSTTYFQGKSAFEDEFGFFHPSISATQLEQNQLSSLSLSPPCVTHRGVII